jgi:hypothetical protein
VQPSEPVVTALLPGIDTGKRAVLVSYRRRRCGKLRMCVWRGGSVGRRRNREDGLAVTRELQPRSPTRVATSSRHHHAWSSLG